jgi:hypothetical protein
MFAVFLAVTALIPNASAKQQSFNTYNNGQKTTFDYSWRHQDKSYQLNFSIENTSLNNMPRSPARYSKRVFQDTVYAKVMAVAKEIDPTIATVSVRKNNQSALSYNVRSRSEAKGQEILDKLSQAFDQAEQDYWQDNLFTLYASPNGKTAIRHDHAKYTQLSSDALSTIVREIKALQQNPRDVREFLQIALSWIQTIPYNTLEDRLNSNGAGFASPRDVLLQNQGDCDSKSTLMAALVRAYNKRLSVAMVYLPEHALLAIGMNPLPGEVSIRIENTAYVLVEPTGPAQLAIGEVDKATNMALLNQQFSTSPL